MYGTAAGRKQNSKSQKRYFDQLPPAGLVVIDHGKMVVGWGDTARKIKISSMRKSLLSALYGIYQDNGYIPLDSSLASLGIDDNPALTPPEKTATIRMLLQARSGIYHSYVAGTPSMRSNTPLRGSHLPGSFWYYNNWDFNALGGIFEQLTGRKIADAFNESIAKPTGMEDFLISDFYYLYARPDAKEYEKSVYPAYHFRMTARDMARFGYLFLHGGNWNGRQIIPAHWVKESLTSYSLTEEGGGYGYLWWINGLHLPAVSFSAQGALGKYLVVIPEYDLVISYLNDAEFPDYASQMPAAELNKLPSETLEQFTELVSLILAAKN